jgi:hypothetical protein
MTLAAMVWIVSITHLEAIPPFYLLTTFFHPYTPPGDSFKH